MFVTAHEDLEDICGIIKNIANKNVNLCCVDEDSSENFIPTTVVEKEAKTNKKMMHLVPSCSPHPPTFDASQLSQLDFDLDLLPLSDCQVPSPTSSLSPLDLPVSPTMFSPDNSKDDRRYAGVPSPGSSMSPSSPYSPAGRGERKISTQSAGLQEVDMSSINLQESLLEFTQLQDKIKQEQDFLLDSNSGALSLDTGLAGPSFPMSMPSHRYSMSSEGGQTYPLSPDSTHQSQDVKLEPLDFLEKSAMVPTMISKTHTVTSQTQQPPSISIPLSSRHPSSSSVHPSLLTMSSPTYLQAPHHQQEHTLLKQCLQDTSFQTKYNLKPFDFGVTTGFVSEQSSTKLKAMQRSDVKKEPLSEGPRQTHKPLKPTLSDVKIEPLLDLAADQVSKEITNTCEMLSISSNPRQWSNEDVKSWLYWTVQQFSIPMSLLDLDLWNMDGQSIMTFGEEEFKQRLPQREGETLFAQFDIWRTNSIYEQTYIPQSCGQESQQVPRYAPPPYPDYWQEGPVSGAEGHHQQGPPSHESISHNPDNFSDIAYMLQMLDHQNNPVGDPQTHYITPKTEPGLGPQYSPHHSHQTSPPPYPGSDHHSEAGTVGSDYGVDPMEEEEDEEEEEPAVPIKAPSRPGTNIHLWQFVKELLMQPNLYGNYIHWIDRPKGIFKIVDSVKVATLWGKRKNRPAMNYDKLSRSLRQYYKKGIMKKTERSQRLVYQFCHPYHL